MTYSGIGFAGPVLEGMEERWRRFLQELASTRRKDYEDLRHRLGVARYEVWLVRIRRTDLAVVYLECAEPETIVARLAASTEPFALWLTARLAEFHGCDLARPHLRRPPELVFDSDGRSSDPRHET